MNIELKRNIEFRSSDIEILYEDFIENNGETEQEEGSVEKKEKRIDLSEDDFNREIDQSYKKGYSEGMINAIEKFENEHLEKINLLNEFSDHLIKEKDDLFSELEGQVINIAIAVSEKIVKQELSENTDILINLVKKGFEKLKSSLKFTLYLNDKSKTYFKSLKLRLAKQKSASISFELDDKLEEYDFYIESDQGNIYHILSDIYEQIKNMNKQ
jgi:flagellar assembly protein FliH